MPAPAAALALAPHAARFAAGRGFLSAVGNFLKGPGGYALASAPIAMDALGQLGANPADPAGNVAASAGSVGGGLGGGILGGVLGSRLGPGGRLAGFGLGAWLGSQGGGGLARNASTAVQGLLDDPVAKGIRDMERMYRSETELNRERVQAMLPATEIAMRMEFEDQARRAALASRLQGQAAYQNSLFQAANAPVGAYMDPNLTAMFSNFGIQGLR